MDARFKVLIVDDEELARISIKTLLKDEVDWSIIGEAHNGLEAQNMISNLKPDLVFLDVDMPKLDGISVLQINRFAEQTRFIMTTAYTEFAIPAFDHEVVDYLLKPYTDSRFKEALNRAKKQIENEAKVSLINSFDLKANPNYLSRIAVKSLGKIQLVDADDILHIKANGNYAEIFTKSSRYLHSEKISVLEQKLDPSKFIRIHRSTIVKLSEISELKSHSNSEYVIVMKNGARLKMSRSYKHQIEAIIS